MTEHFSTYSDKFHSLVWQSLAWFTKYLWFFFQSNSRIAFLCILEFMWPWNKHMPMNIWVEIMCMTTRWKFQELTCNYSYLIFLPLQSWAHTQTLNLIHMASLNEDDVELSPSATLCCSCVINEQETNLCHFIWLCPRHVEVPGPGIEPVPQKWPCQILNLLSHQGTPKPFHFYHWDFLDCLLR